MNNNYYSEFNNSNKNNSFNYNNISRNNFLDDDYIDNAIKKNNGKRAKIHVTIPGAGNWQDKVFDGIIDYVGKDHVILVDINNTEKYIIPLIYLGFVTINE